MPFLLLHGENCDVLGTYPTKQAALEVVADTAARYGRPVLPGMASAASLADRAVVQSLTFAIDDGAGAAGQSVTSFRPSDHTLHAVIRLGQVLVNPNVHVSWTAVEIDAGSNIFIGDVPLNGIVTNLIDAHIALPSDFPTGKYRVDFYLDDRPDLAVGGVPDRSVKHVVLPLVDAPLVAVSVSASLVRNDAYGTLGRAGPL